MCQSIKYIIKTDVITIKVDDSLKKVMSLMNDKKINGAPVVDENNCLVGMIVKADIYRFLMEEGHYDTCPVDWVMTKQVITCNENDDILSIAKKIRSESIISIPVVENSKVIGIVSIEDILDYFINKE